MTRVIIRRGWKRNGIKEPYQIIEENENSITLITPNLIKGLGKTSQEYKYWKNYITGMPVYELEIIKGGFNNGKSITSK